jgi:ribosomal protein S18 acetylase RimI-like enzyme
MSNVTHRAATDADAGPLAAFFADTFRETFGHLYQAADLTAFLAQHTAAHWLDQLRDEAIAIRIADHDGLIVGLAKLGPLKLPVSPTAPALELRQLYVAPEFRGSGAAASLMLWLLGEARARGAEQAFLSVYTENKRAQRFYARYGFVDVGPCVFMVGDQADEDRIMRARLT